MIEAVMGAEEDGTIHLPVPVAWRHLPIRVRAEMEPKNPSDGRIKLGAWKCLGGDFGCRPILMIRWRSSHVLRTPQTMKMEGRYLTFCA